MKTYILRKPSTVDALIQTETDAPNPLRNDATSAALTSQILASAPTVAAASLVLFIGLDLHND